MGDRRAGREGSSFRTYESHFHNSGVRSGRAHERSSNGSRSGVFQKLTPSHIVLPRVSNSGVGLHVCWDVVCSKIGLVPGAIGVANHRRPHDFIARWPQPKD
jgi:hypothetical protein